MTDFVNSIALAFTLMMRKMLSVRADNTIGEELFVSSLMRHNWA